MYTQLLDEKSQEVRLIRDEDTGFYFAQDKANPRYRAYLSWVANGGSPIKTVINVTAPAQGT